MDVLDRISSARQRLRVNLLQLKGSERMEDIAEAAGICGYTLSRIINMRGNPTLETLERLAIYFGVEVRDLLK